jgi:glycerophosphoryl diester phosphodiesterase
MRVVAHRGCPVHGPENTIAAARAALPHVDWIEVDVRRCGSGEVVVVHDETLDRVTDSSGRVDATPLSALQDVRVDGSDEPVPTLAAVLEALPASVTVNVELKEPDVAADVVALARPAAPTVVVSAFDDDALGAVRAADGGESLPLAALFVDDWDAGLATVRAVAASFVHPHHASVTADRVRRAHDAGVEVNAWTLGPDDADAVDRLRAAGVDGLIVDSWRVI